MEDLIKALQIFLKYGNPYAPTHCEHDIMYISSDIMPDDVSPEDTKALEELGFFVEEEFGGFASFRYGSC